MEIMTLEIPIETSPWYNFVQLIDLAISIIEFGFSIWFSVVLSGCKISSAPPLERQMISIIIIFIVFVMLNIPRLVAKRVFGVKIYCCTRNAQYITECIEILILLPIIIWAWTVLALSLEGNQVSRDIQLIFTVYTISVTLLTILGFLLACLLVSTIEKPPTGSPSTKVIPADLPVSSAV
jgi:hypothetical protein